MDWIEKVRLDFFLVPLFPRACHSFLTALFGIVVFFFPFRPLSRRKMPSSCLIKCFEVSFFPIGIQIGPKRNIKAVLLNGNSV